MIKELGWESLKRRRKKLRVQMLHKMLNNIVILAPTTVTRMESSYYDLWDFNNQRIHPLYCQTDMFKHSFFPEAIEL